jgi:hypothetical protein
VAAAAAAVGVGRGAAQRSGVGGSCSNS